MSEPAHAIAIPRTAGPPPSSSGAFHFDAIFSPTSMTSPLSMESPFSASSAGSLGGGHGSGSSTGMGPSAQQHMLASSFATTVSSHSVASPSSSEDHKSSADTHTNVAKGDEQGVAKKHKPHKCDVCGACFARKVHLQRHSLRHQVCKPYCCDRCNKCFSRQDSLVRHHRLLHEKSKSDKKLLHIESLAAGPRGKNISMACVRCSSISVPCDGQQPCKRCLANHGGESCVYAPSSSPLTIGAATAKSLKRTKKQQRHQQQQLKEEGSPSHVEDSTSASENVPWATFGHGRRDTVSSVASGWSDATSTTSPIFQTGMDDLPASAWGPQHLQSNMPPFYEQQAQLQHWQQQQLHAQQMDGLHQSANGHMAHPFDMPEMESSTSVPPAANGNATNFVHGAGQVQESMDMDADDLSMPHLMSLIGYSGQETPMARNQGAHHAAAMPNIDWNSMLQNLAQEGRFSHNHAQGSQQGFDDGLSHEHGLPGQSDGDKQPFSGAASDKDLNATLFNAMDQSSNYSSPAVAGLHPSQVQQPHPTGALSFDVSSACNGMAANGVATQQPPQQEQQPSHQQGDVVSLAALGIPIPPMLNISLPANLQMSADNWDSFMRCLSSYAVGRQGNAPATHHSVSAVESGLHNAANTSAQA